VKPATAMEGQDMEARGTCRCHRSWENATATRVSCGHGRAAWGSSLRCRTRASPPPQHRCLTSHVWRGAHLLLSRAKSASLPHEILSIATRVGGTGDESDEDILWCNCCIDTVQVGHLNVGVAQPDCSQTTQCRSL
jgi:hypothetical protein